LYPKQAR